MFSRGRVRRANSALSAAAPVRELLEKLGEIPLPPYIHRKPDAQDSERYQTVFATHPGSVAAPTAGLHFTAGDAGRMRAAGAEIAQVTLHVGHGTFAPLRSEKLAEIRFTKSDSKSKNPMRDRCAKRSAGSAWAPRACER